MMWWAKPILLFCGKVSTCSASRIFIVFSYLFCSKFCWQNLSRPIYLHS